MFEDFREQTDESLFEDQDATDEELRDELSVGEPEVHFLGMTAAQRFALTFLLFLMTSILGILFLLITERVTLPTFG